MLSRVYEQKKATNDLVALNIIQSISLIAWRHVNLVGKFEFSPSTFQVDIEALAARYDDPVYWSKTLQEQSEDDLQDWH